MSRRIRVLLGLLVMLAQTAVGDTEPPSYPHASFRSWQVGTGPRSYWLFEPTQPSPPRAPIVVFHHGWLAVNPGVYGAWLEHLVRSGAIVVYPRYQADWRTSPAEFLPNAAAAVRDAFDVLETTAGHPQVDCGRFAIIGHSAGGNLSVLMAAAYKEVGLPLPQAVVAVMPGEVRPVSGPPLDHFPSKTLLVVVAGDQDIVVGDSRARTIFAGTTAVPLDRKLFVLYRSDRNAVVPLLADHLAPTAGLEQLDSGEGPLRNFQMGHATVDVLDRHGFWRLADITMAAAFAGKTLDEATEHGELLRDLGHWGDGTALLPPIVGTDLRTIPHVVPSQGVRLISWNPDEWFNHLGAGK